jgi:hypothetical protein
VDSEITRRHNIDVSDRDTTFNLSSRLRNVISRLIIYARQEVVGNGNVRLGGSPICLEITNS